MRTEDEIISNWKDKNSVLVSIICATYNQEMYIEEAINSFLVQKTIFPFEIIIHDDSSTDATQSIIKEYQKLYPNIIKCILQEENQYSKGGFRPLAFAGSYAKGNYIAFCEGDDYWQDEYKLTKQVNLISKTPEVSLVITDFDIYDMERKKIFRNNMLKNKESYMSNLKLENFILNTPYMAPPSWLFHRKHLPDYKTSYTDATFCWFIDFLKTGKVLVIYEPMVVYRKLKESASHSMNLDKLILREKNILATQLKYFYEMKSNSFLIEKAMVNHLQKIIVCMVSRKLTFHSVNYLFSILKMKYMCRIKIKYIFLLFCAFIPFPYKKIMDILK